MNKTCQRLISSTVLRQAHVCVCVHLIVFKLCLVDVAACVCLHLPLTDAFTHSQPDTTPDKHTKTQKRHLSLVSVTYGAFNANRCLITRKRGYNKHTHTRTDTYGMWMLRFFLRALTVTPRRAMSGSPPPKPSRLRGHEQGIPSIPLGR